MRKFMVAEASGEYVEVSAVEMAYIVADELKTKLEDTVVIDSPSVVKALCRSRLAHLEYEVFGVMFLDSKHRLIAFEEMFRGTIDEASVYPREVVKEALRHNASAVIFTHNHPSGDPEPSRADRTITDRLKSALDLIGVRSLDHIVVGDTFVSFAERGWM